MLSRTLDLDGPVHVADFGGAGPTMVLVHGLGGSHANWLAVGPAHVALARERQQMPWAHPAFLEAARSIFAILARSRDMQAMVRRIAAPTLLIQGSEDRLVPLAAARALAALRPDWSLEVFERVGHVPQLEAPERFVATVAAWLRDATCGTDQAASGRSS